MADHADDKQHKQEEHHDATDGTKPKAGAKAPAKADEKKGDEAKKAEAKPQEKAAE